MKFDITASIVLYQNKREIVSKAINSFLSCPLSIKIFLIDNSPTNHLSDIAQDSRVEYIFNEKNLGFGKAHNIALKKIIELSSYHLILNPDVYFDGDVLTHIHSFMEQNHQVGQLMPQVLYPDGRIQYAGKLLPSPLDLLGRRILKKVNYFKRKNVLYELQATGYDHIMNVPNHLGCFMFIRTKILSNVGIFDEQIFMYMEDVDLTRRIHKHSETLFYPFASIYHFYEKGSQKKIRLLLFHIKSAFYYFNKWGWFFDRDRTFFNRLARKTSGLKKN